MLKAINVIQWLVANPGPTQDFLATPGNVDTVITWARNPAWGPTWGAWEQSDEAVQWALSHGKRCMVCVTSSDLPPGWGYAERRQLVFDTIDRYPECSVIVSNEPSFAPAVARARSLSVAAVIDDKAIAMRPAHDGTKEALAAYLRGGPLLASAAGPRIRASESAQLMKDAAEHAAGLKSGTGSTHLLGPAEATFWGTPNCLKYLWGYAPPKGVRVDVAMHHYYDLVNGGARMTRTALAAMKLLRLHGSWRPNLFLTEGGYIFHVGRSPAYNPADPSNPAGYEYLSRAADEAMQLQRIMRFYPWCKKQSQIALWANYEVVDSLSSGWASGPFAHDGTLKLILPHWAGL